MSFVGGPPPLPKLPVWDVVGQAYSDYFGHFADVLRVSWLWLVMGAALFGVLNWQQWSLLGTVIFNSIQHSPFPPSFAATAFGTMALTMGIADVVLFLAFVSIAVAWHRRIILDERPSFCGFNIATRSFWRYIGVGLAIGLLVILPLLLVLVLLVVILSIAGKGNHPGIAFVVVPLMVAAYVATIAIALRLSMLLPARAAGDLDLNFARSWNRTRGNGLRIFCGILICMFAPPMAAEMVLFPMAMPSPAAVLAAGPNAIPAFIAGGDFAVRMTTITTFLMAFYLLTMPVGIGFLSVAYRHFFREAISPTL
jgi:hypothetical protein